MSPLIRTFAILLVALTAPFVLFAEPAHAAATVHFDARQNTTFSPSERNSRTAIFVTGLDPLRNESVTKTVNSTSTGQPGGTSGSQPAVPPSTTKNIDACSPITTAECLKTKANNFNSQYNSKVAAFGLPPSLDRIFTGVDNALRLAGSKDPTDTLGVRVNAFSDASSYQAFVEKYVTNPDGPFDRAKSDLVWISTSQQAVAELVTAKTALGTNVPTDVAATITALSAAVSTPQWAAFVSAANDALTRALGTTSRDFLYQDTESCNTLLAARSTHYAVMQATKELAGFTVHCKSEWYGGGIYVFSRLDSTTYSIGQSGFLASPAPAPVQNVIVANTNVNVRRFTQPVGHFCPASLNWEHVELCGSIAPAIQTGGASYGGGDGVLIGATILSLNRALGLSLGGHLGQVNQLQQGYTAGSQLLPGTSIDQVLTHPYKLGFYWGIVFSAPTQ